MQGTYSPLQAGPALVGPKLPASCKAASPVGSVRVLEPSQPQHTASRPLLTLQNSLSRAQAEETSRQASRQPRSCVRGLMALSRSASKAKLASRGISKRGKG